LCARKVGHYEARRPSHAFGKDELNLDITSTRRVEPTPRHRDNNDGNEQHAPVRPSCAARPVAELGCTKMNQQMTGWSFVRALCDADVSCTADGRRRRPVGGLVAVAATWAS
jgi:hypothetical protein